MHGYIILNNNIIKDIFLNEERKIRIINRGRIIAKMNFSQVIIKKKKINI